MVNPKIMFTMELEQDKKINFHDIASIIIRLKNNRDDLDYGNSTYFGKSSKRLVPFITNQYIHITFKSKNSLETLLKKITRQYLIRLMK